MMKKIFQFTALLIFCLLGACSEDALDNLSGKYDMERHVYTKVTEQSTEKVGKGVKRLSFLFEDEAGKQWSLVVYSRDWVLQGGIYQLGESLEATVPGTFLCSVSTVLSEDNELHSYAYNGTLEVTLLGDTYYLDGLFQVTDGKQYSCDYIGPLSFEIGEDDPEASGYTSILSVQPVYLTDQSGQVTGIAPGVQKYTFSINDPDGNLAASFDAINTENLDVTALAGEYTIQGNAAEPWLFDNGWALPAEWGGWYGGSYVVQNGTKQFLTGGKITISVVDGIEGGKLYTFAGSGLTSTLGMDATGANIPGTLSEVKIPFVTVLQSTGIELRDLTMQSTVLDKEMAYSVYLPKGYFENMDKTYPVLYLLNGADGGNNDWLNGGMVNPYASTLAAEGGREMIVVCPNGCPDGKNVFYCDNYQNLGYNYMTYFFDEFLPFIESNYRVKAERGSRAIGGLSMGGFGSLYYGFLHPEMFCYVYACSPATYIEGAPNLYEMLGTQDLPGITIEIGTGDFLFESAGYFKQALDGMGIAHEYITRDGVHDWAFWAACTPKMLKKVGEVFAAE